MKRLFRFLGLSPERGVLKTTWVVAQRVKFVVPSGKRVSIIRINDVTKDLKFYVSIEPTLNGPPLAVPNLPADEVLDGFKDLKEGDWIAMDEAYDATNNAAQITYMEYNN